MNWRPIDSAPKDGSDVLLFSPDAADPKIFVGNWLDDHDHPDGGAWWDTWQDGYFPIDADPTHWMPLPEPPR